MRGKRHARSSRRSEPARSRPPSVAPPPESHSAPTHRTDSPRRAPQAAARNGSTTRRSLLRARAAARSVLHRRGYVRGRVIPVRAGRRRDMAPVRSGCTLASCAAGVSCCAPTRALSFVPPLCRSTMPNAVRRELRLSHDLEALTDAPQSRAPRVSASTEHSAAASSTRGQIVMPGLDCHVPSLIEPRERPPGPVPESNPGDCPAGEFRGLARRDQTRAQQPIEGPVDTPGRTLENSACRCHQRLEHLRAVT